MGLFSSLLGPIVGGIIGGRNARDQSEDIERYRREDLEANRQNWADQLRASRFNRTNPFQSVTWSQGPDGNWTQETKFNPEQQALHERQQQINANRMGIASGIDLSRYSKGIDYDALGLGYLNRAAGGTGSTGKRPWADNPWSSAGGEYLNYFSSPPVGGQLQLSATPWNPQMLPTGGGNMIAGGNNMGGGIGVPIDVAAMLAMGGR